MDYLSPPMFFSKLHAAWKKTIIFCQKKREGGERESILVHPYCFTSCMQHGKKETEGNGKNLIFFLQNVLTFFFYLCKSKTKHNLLLFVKHEQSVLVETNLSNIYSYF